MKIVVALLLACVSCCTLADSPREIFDANARSIVYIEILDDKGGLIDNGTGFIVSQDGYVVTAAHLKADPTQKAWATIGQRAGTRYPLDAREVDEKMDAALWQLPQSTSCRQPVTLSSKSVERLDSVMAMGFPGTDGLSPATFLINNLSSALGFYKADGDLRPGNSGGPVFNKSGHVVAFVEGGAVSGAANNDLVPIAAAIKLLEKRHVNFGLNAPIAFDTSCYASCRDPSHGVERWATENNWGPVQTGWLGGGNSRSAQCGLLMAADQARTPNSLIELLPGEGDSSKGMWEDSNKDVFGHVEYRYHCQGKIKTGPIYVQKQSSACPLSN